MPVDVCRGLSIFFLDDLSCRIFVTSIFCPLDVLSVDVLTVSLEAICVKHNTKTSTSI